MNKYELERFYTKNYKKFVNKVFCKVGRNYDIAEDVVQESFCRAIRFQTSYNPKRGNYEQWFNRILFNTLKDFQRKHKNNLEDCEDLTSFEVLGIDCDRVSPEKKRIIADSIRKIPNRKHRVVLELFFILGYSCREICMVEYDMSITNVTTIVKRFNDSF